MIVHIILESSTDLLLLETVELDRECLVNEIILRKGFYVL